MRYGVAVATALVVAAGAHAQFVVTPVALHQPPDGDAVRAMWCYAHTNFDTSAEGQALLDFCAREGINTLYCGAYSVWYLGTATQKANLRTFIETAHASGIRMEAMFGGTDWQADPAKVRTKIDQVLSLHTATPTNDLDDFDAVHFDVEFWIDSSWSAAANETERQAIAIDYLDNVLVNARQYLDAQGETDMDISVALSAHLENSDKLPTPFLYNGTTQSFLGHVFDNADGVVIMSYIDYASGLLSWTGFELDVASGKSRMIQLGADIQPVPPAASINSFDDNSPTGYASMTTTLESFHTLLTPVRLAVLEGFAVFQYTGYGPSSPNPHNLADLDGDEDVDADDFAQYADALAGPTVTAIGLDRDSDLNEDGAADLLDFAIFSRCYTGAGVTSPVPTSCER